VERYALKTILDGKKYFPSANSSEELYEKIITQIEAIYHNLNKVDEIAKIFKDGELLQMSKEARVATNSYQKYFEDGAKLFSQRKETERNLRLKGRIILKMAGEYKEDQVKSLEMAIAANMPVKERRKRNQNIDICNSIKIEILHTRRHEKNYIIYKEEKELKELKDGVAALIKLYDKLTLTTEKKLNLERIATARQATNDYLKAANIWVESYHKLNEILPKMDELGRKVIEKAKAQEAKVIEDMAKSGAAAKKISGEAGITAFAAALMALLSGGVIAVLISRSITNPMRRLVLASGKIAKGDFTQKIDVRTKDEIGQLSMAFDKMREDLKKIITNLNKEIAIRNQAEGKLRLFSHSVESSADGIAMGNFENRITYVNEAFVGMFGYSKEELIDKEIAFIYSEDQIPKLEEALKATMRGGWVGELVGKRKDGGLFSIAVSTSVVVDNEGRAIAQMANHRDISESKKMEEQQRKLMKDLEETNRIMVGRELRMIELKEEVNKLNKELKMPEPYDVSFEDGQESK